MADEMSEADQPIDPAPDEAEATTPVEKAMASVEGAAESVQEAADEIATGAGSSDLSMPDFDDGPAVVQGSSGLSLLNDVDLNVRIELGRTRMYVEDVLRLNADSVIELDKAAGDPVDIFVNDRHVARGEVLVLNEAFCVRVSEILPAQD